MRAHLEWLCEHAGIIRMGPHSEVYGDPYDYAVAFVVSANLVTIKALAADGGFTTAHARAAIDALQELGFQVRWDRLGGATERNVKVPKKELPKHGSVIDAHKGRAGKNEIDLALVKERVTGLLAAAEKGEIIIESMVGHPTAVRGKHRMDGVTVMWRLPD